jgi:hypothetical protein
MIILLLGGQLEIPFTTLRILLFINLIIIINILMMVMMGGVSVAAALHMTADEL